MYMPEIISPSDIELAKLQAQKMDVLYEELTTEEIEKLDQALRRILKLYYPQREIVDLFLRRKVEIITGCMVAKKQFSKTFDGESPKAGNFGISITRAAYFGIGDDWDDAAPFSTGSPQNWIHSGTTLLGGTAGNPIKIGENAVHVIIGIASLHPSPKIESFKFKINGNEKPVITTGWLWRASGIAIKELEKSLLLRKDMTVLCQVFISAKFGSSVDDIPYLVGVSYLPEDVLKIHDPVDIVKTTAKVVLTT